MLYSQLRTFYAVATEGSFTKAADRLYITQPAVSKQIKELEETYGVMLCSRGHGAVTLTDCGEQLFDIVKQIIRLDEVADDFLRSASQLEPTKFCVGADSPYSVGKLMSAYCTRHPGLPVSLTIGTAEDIHEKVMSCAIDIAVLVQVQPNPELVVVPLVEHEILIVVPTTHDLARKDTIQLREIVGQPIVMRSTQTSLTSRVFEETLQQNDISPFVILTVDSREAMREAVASGIGIGVIVAYDLGSDRRIKGLRVEDQHMTIPENVVCLKRRRDLRAISSFLELSAKITAGEPDDGGENQPPPSTQGRR